MRAFQAVSLHNHPVRRQLHTWAYTRTSLLQASELREVEDENYMVTLCLHR